MNKRRFARGLRSTRSTRSCGRCSGSAFRCRAPRFSRRPGASPDWFVGTRSPTGSTGTLLDRRRARTPRRLRAEHRGEPASAHPARAKWLTGNARVLPDDDPRERLDMIARTRRRSTLNVATDPAHGHRPARPARGPGSGRGLASRAVNESTPTGTVASDQITPGELRLAARNHGLPLEALRDDDHAGRAPLPADPLRHPGGRPRGLRLDGRTARWSGRCRSAWTTCGPCPGSTLPVTLRVRGQRASPAGSAAAEPALADRGRRHRGVGRHAAARRPRRGRACDAGAVEILFTGARPRRRGRHGQAYARSLPIADALEAGRAARRTR